MFKHSLQLGCIIVTGFVCACQPREVKPPSTFTVKTTDFEDALEIDGLVQPVQVNTLVTPAFVDGVVAYIVEDGTYVKAGDTVCVIEDKNVSQEYDDMLDRLENGIAELNKTKADLDLQYSMLEAQIKSNIAETEIANLDSLQINFSTQVQARIKKLELEKVTIERNKLQKKLKSMAIINQSEITKLELRNQTLQARIDMAKAQLDQLKLTAPKNGIATRAIHPMTRKKMLPTDPVWNRMPLVIIPETDKMKVLISASEGDYKRIETNDPVEYSFDAMPGNKASGTIQKKAPIGQPVKENSKVKMFEIEASIDKSLVVPGPDLTARCKIILKHISDTLVIPQICIYEEDSLKYVYVQKSNTFEKRQVLLGEESLKEAVVKTGLKPKEKIALVKPEATLVNGVRMLAKPVVKKHPTKNPTTKTI
ncbi:MAG TPA: HlyD family efflux transporter periplasmic adaptor subunit [Paludibacter sp.]|nr:HlyD family efflux transporter periplasmic adaptor subunit [Paludibacter sp.]